MGKRGQFCPAEGETKLPPKKILARGRESLLADVQELKIAAQKWQKVFKYLASQNVIPFLLRR